MLPKTTYTSSTNNLDKGHRPAFQAPIQLHHLSAFNKRMDWPCARTILFHQRDQIYTKVPTCMCRILMSSAQVVRQASQYKKRYTVQAFLHLLNTLLRKAN